MWSGNYNAYLDKNNPYFYFYVAIAGLLVIIAVVGTLRQVYRTLEAGRERKLPTNQVFLEALYVLVRDFVIIAIILYIINTFFPVIDLFGEFMNLGFGGSSGTTTPTLPTGSGF